VEAVVVGLPLDPNGEESDWTRTVREFGEAVGRRAGIPVHFVDERFTSARAERAVRSLGLPRRKREQKERVDAAAAILILQAWLDRRSELAEGPGALGSDSGVSGKVMNGEDR
jgi:putative Holliday junction resolvase